MDAIIVDGTSLKFGAVAGLRAFANPVSVARAVLEKTPHHFLIADGAHKFALEQGFEEVDPQSLVTDDARAELARYKQYQVSVGDLFNTAKCQAHDTVGAVAFDENGRFAAATSTGGITAKRAGRVGDSCIIGCGAIADTFGACSTTGHGESIMRSLLAKRALDLMEASQPPSDACQSALQYMFHKTNGCGGIIAISPQGVAYHFTTKHMSWASVTQIESPDSPIQFDSGI